MSSSDFIKEMSAEGQKVSSGGQGVVGRVLLEFGVHSYVEGHGYWDFWTVTKGGSDIPVAFAEVSQRVKEAGGKNRVNFGLKVTLFNDVLGKEHYKGDLVEFVPKWQEEAYNMVCEAASENGLVFNEVFYGQVQFKANPYHVGQGEAGKTKTDQSGNPAYPTIKVPVKKFASKDEAQSFVDGNMPVNGPALPPFSDKAKKTYGNNLQALATDTGVPEWYTKALGGEAVPESEPLPKPLNAETAKGYIARIWGIETTDVDLVIEYQENSPF
jgi:hypothetical protein